MGCTARRGGTKVLHDLDGGGANYVLSYCIGFGRSVYCKSKYTPFFILLGQRNLAEHFTRRYKHLNITSTLQKTLKTHEGPMFATY